MAENDNITEIAALIMQCRIAALAVEHGVEALQNRADAAHLSEPLAILHKLSSDSVDALDETLNAIWGGRDVISGE
jgi:hypothetical protein